MKRGMMAAVAAVMTIVSCGKTDEYAWVRNAVSTAESQLLLTADEIKGSGRVPRSIWTDYDMDMLCRQLERDSTEFRDSLRKRPSPELLGKRRLADIYDWTSGFYPGSLWITYELTSNPEVEKHAKYFTNILEPLRHYTGTHDLGFMVRCSFGKALSLAPADSIKDVIVETADNLASRFRPETGVIRSWDFGKWNYPVIIDNMMNLDLLFDASRLTGDPKYKAVAVAHANTTMRCHFRDDMTSYHVVSYNDDGSVECRQTFQGKADESAWARGQAWGLYGFISCFENTSDTVYLDMAVAIAEMIMSRVVTEDAVPYWDYDAPVTEETPRDASAGAVTASAMLELSLLPVSDAGKYFDYGEKILKSLSSPDYLAVPGTNEGFVLKHSVGSLPHGSEIDTPLNYADYYYLEALKRYIEIKKIKL